MNVTSDALTRAYALAHDSGKVDDARLAKALALVPQVVKTLSVVHTDLSRMDEYWIPGSKHTGYVVTVTDGKSVSGCTCKDSQQRETPYCKHRLAVMLIVRSGELVPGSVTANAPEVESPLVERSRYDADYRKRMVAAMYPKEID